MCLLLVARGAHPRYPLVIAANRDEFHERPTESAHWWTEPPVLAGRDQRAGGTWFAVTAEGRFAAVTNYRDPAAPEPGRRSRGELPLRALAYPSSELGERLASGLSDYAGVNLMAGDVDRIDYLSNRGAADVAAIEEGVHGLSNERLDTPWPKVVRGRALLARLLRTRDALAPEPLFELLRDTSVPADEDLPDTGIGLEWERRLAPMFIVSPRYGTRCSTLLWCSRQGEWTFAERRYDPEGRDLGTVVDQFSSRM